MNARMHLPARLCLARKHRHLASVATELEEDIRAYWRRSGIEGARAVTPWRWASALLDPAITCVLLHRLAHWAWVRQLPLVPGLLAGCNRLLFKATISPPSCVGGAWSVRHPAGLHFHAVAGRELTLLACASCTADDVPLGSDLERAPILGDRVQVGANAAVVGPVVIGDDVTVGFRVVVIADISANARVMSDASRVCVKPSAQVGGSDSLPAGG